MIQIILVTLLAISIMLGILMVAIWKRRKPEEEKEIDYQAFFAMGISFVGVGVVLTATINAGFLGFVGLGIIYMILGLSKRDKWKKKQ